MSLYFLIKVRCNLRSIEDETKARKPLTRKSILVCFFIIAFLATIILILRQGYEMENTTFLHFNILLNTVMIFIVFPKYVISQNENLQLYVSVYHHHPPPVLPWQLPENFDCGSVKLTIAKKI